MEKATDTFKQLIVTAHNGDGWKVEWVSIPYNQFSLFLFFFPYIPLLYISQYREKNLGLKNITIQRSNTN